MKDKKNSLDVLKQPVHTVVLRPHHLQDLQREGKLPSGGVIKSTPPAQNLPKPPSKKKTAYNPLHRFNVKNVNTTTKRAMHKTRLAVLYDRVKPLPDHLVPPCAECKTSACCTAFVVGLTKDEYESGLFAPHAVKLDPKYMKQLQGSLLLPSTATSPVLGHKEVPEYYLEGRLGVTCPLLIDNKCSVYDYRPLTCRVYTCVEDSRVTPRMREDAEEIYAKYTVEDLEDA